MWARRLAALSLLELSRRHLIPGRGASAAFWAMAGDGAAIATDSEVRQVRIGEIDLSLVLPLRYRQNWSIALGRMPTQDRMALDVFARAATSARAIFDVGMNAGSYLYTAVGYRQPGVPVVGFEPDPQISAAVRANIERNALTNVIIETCAVSAVSGTARLHRASSDQMHSLDRAFLDRAGSLVVGQEDVRTVTIDDAAADCGLDPDLIKIDVEGHEAAVIRGAAGVIDRTRPTLLLEMGAASADGALFETLLGYGYKAALLATSVIPLESRSAFMLSRERGFENYLFCR
jgi:FkbM family methyltransferase